MKDILGSYKGFVAIMPLIIFVVMISLCFAYIDIINTRLKTMDNLNKISKDIIIKTKVVNEFKCLMNEEINSFMVDDIKVNVKIEGDYYILSYQAENIKVKYNYELAHK